MTDTLKAFQRSSSTDEIVRAANERKLQADRLAAWQHVAQAYYNDENGCGENCDCYACNLFRIETEKDARLNA